MAIIQHTLRTALAGLAFAVASAGDALALSVPPAVDVTVGGSVFTISALTDVGVNVSDQLEAQPWFGDEDLASDLALALDDALGSPPADGRAFPPLFAFQISVFSPSFVRSVQSSEGAAETVTTNPFNQTASYAIAESVAPIPLPPAAALLLGGLGALAFVRQRRA